MPSKEYFREYRRRNNPKLKEKEDLAQQEKKRCTKCNVIKSFKDYIPQKVGFMRLKSQCKECDLKYDKNYQEKTNFRSKRDKTDKVKQYRKKYIAENIDWWRKYEREYRYERRKEDMFFKIKGNISGRLSDLINKRNLSTNTTELIGCNRETFINHIEKQFTEGMDWENYGLKGWHVDHIIPLSSFDLTIESEVKKACHYTNLQPLWWQDNLEKSNKVIIFK
jgi:hypothetical protein